MTLDAAIYTLTVILCLVGVVANFVPFLPGSVIVFAAGVIHRVVLGPDGGVTWTTIAALFVLLLLAQLVDFLAGMLGAKKYGASKWGALGALGGAIVGLFFGIPGIIVGPIAGALGAELIAGKKVEEAGRASWGTLIGTLLGMAVKLAISVVMAVWLLADIFLFRPKADPLLEKLDTTEEKALERSGIGHYGWGNRFRS